MLIYYLSLLDTQAEKDLLETIYYEYRTRMKRLALNMLRNDEDAEDAVQQAFLRLINALNRIDDPYSDETKAFLMIVQKYACLDLLRTKKKQITYDLDEILDQKYAQKIDLLENLTVEYIKKQIDRLPETYRDTLALKVYYELPDDEIANLLAVSTATVRKRLGRARELLNKKIER